MTATSKAATMRQTISIGDTDYRVWRIIDQAAPAALAQFAWQKIEGIEHTDRYTVSLLESGPDCDCTGFIAHGMACNDGRGCKHIRATKALLMQYTCSWELAFNGPPTPRPQRGPKGAKRKPR